MRRLRPFVLALHQAHERRLFQFLKGGDDATFDYIRQVCSFARLPLGLLMAKASDIIELQTLSV